MSKAIAAGQGAGNQADTAAEPVNPLKTGPSKELMEACFIGMEAAAALAADAAEPVAEKPAAWLETINDKIIDAVLEKAIGPYQYVPLYRHPAALSPEAEAAEPVNAAVVVTSVEGNTIGLRIRTALLPRKQPTVILDGEPDAP